MMLMTRILQTSKMATKYMNYESLLGSFIEALGQKLQSRIFCPGFHLQIPAKAHVPMASNGFFSEIRHDFSARGSTSTTTAPMERVQAVVPLEWSIGTLVSDQDSKGKGCKDDK